MDDPVFEYRILEAVHANEGHLTQRDISQEIGCSVSSVNFALRLLAVKGFIKISGANTRRLRYYLTPRGILEKSVLAYNFLKRQISLYEEARKSLLEQLDGLCAEGIRKAAVYGWTPLTEAGLLYLLSQRIKISALYVEKPNDMTHCNRIPCRTIDEFRNDCDVLVLMEPLPETYQEKVTTRKVACFPVA